MIVVGIDVVFLMIVLFLNLVIIFFFGLWIIKVLVWDFEFILISVFFIGKLFVMF